MYVQYFSRKVSLPTHAATINSKINKNILWVYHPKDIFYMRSPRSPICYLLSAISIRQPLANHRISDFDKSGDIGARNQISLGCVFFRGRIGIFVDVYHDLV